MVLFVVQAPVGGASGSTAVPVLMEAAIVPSPPMCGYSSVRLYLWTKLVDLEAWFESLPWEPVVFGGPQAPHPNAP